MNPDLMRLRESAVDKITKVYLDDEFLEKYSMHEGKEIAVQILSEPEVIEQDSILIMIRRWDPVSWELTQIKEIFVWWYMTLNEFGTIMSSMLDIPLENIQACKIISMWNFYWVQLPYETWQSLKGSNNYLAADPFYLSTDGLLFVFKD